MIKLCIFDLDGTLLDTTLDITNSANYALEKFGHPTHTPQIYQSYVGAGLYKTIERAMKENSPKEEVDQVVEVFENHYKMHCCESSFIYPDILDMLKRLKSQGIQLAALSNKMDSYTQPIVKHYFGDIFDVVYGTSDKIAKKPNPQGLLKVIHELNVVLEDCLMVGDTPTDVEVAKNADIKSCAVFWGYRPRGILLDAKANYYAENAEELEAIITKQ